MKTEPLRITKLLQAVSFVTISLQIPSSFATNEQKLQETLKALENAETVEAREKRLGKQQPVAVAPSQAPQSPADIRPIEERADEAIRLLEKDKKPPSERQLAEEKAKQTKNLRTQADQAARAQAFRQRSVVVMSKAQAGGARVGRPAGKSKGDGKKPN